MVPLIIKKKGKRYKEGSLGEAFKPNDACFGCEANAANDYIYKIIYKYVRISM